jgi:hypothetical protein
MVLQTELPILFCDADRISGVGEVFNLDRSVGTITLELHHVMLLENFSALDGAQRLVRAVPFVDAYLAKVKTDWTLSETLASPMRLGTITFGPQQVDRVLVWGFAVALRWEVRF